MRRGCLISVVALLVLCLIACAALYFIGVPRIRDSARDGMRDAMSTAIAVQIPAPAGGTADPGEYELTEDELQAEITGNLDVQNVDDLVIDISPAGLTFRILTDGDQDLTYSGLPVVENGQLRMTNMEASDGFLDWVFPAEDLGEAIEDAANNYLAENGLQLESVELTDDSLILDTVPAR